MNYFSSRCTSARMFTSFRRSRIACYVTRPRNLGLVQYSVILSTLSWFTYRDVLDLIDNLAEFICFYRRNAKLHMSQLA